MRNEHVASLAEGLEGRPLKNVPPQQPILICFNLRVTFKTRYHLTDVVTQKKYQRTFVQLGIK